MNQHVKQIPAYLLALVFIVFGLNHFMHFIPMPDKMPDLVGKFMNAFAVESNYMNVIKVLEILGGVMLILPRTRAMGLCIIAPIVVNILLFELLIAKEAGIGIALIIFSVLAIVFNKEKFEKIWSA